LVDIVPTLSQNHRSEAMILQKCKFNILAWPKRPPRSRH
jgi:hypothetical protein